MTTLREQLEPLIRKAKIARVAEASGVHATRISDWLAGRRDIRVQTLERLAKAVGVRMIADAGDYCRTSPTKPPVHTP